MLRIVLIAGLLLPTLAPLLPDAPPPGQFNPCNPRVQKCG